MCGHAPAARTRAPSESASTPCGTCAAGDAAGPEAWPSPARPEPLAGPPARCRPCSRGAASACSRGAGKAGSGSCCAAAWWVGSRLRPLPSPGTRGEPAGVLRTLPKSLAVSAGEKEGALGARLEPPLPPPPLPAKLLMLSGDGPGLAARSWLLTAGLAWLLPAPLPARGRPKLPPPLPPPKVKGWADALRLPPPPREPSAMLPPPLLVGLSLP